MDSLIDALYEVFIGGAWMHSMKPIVMAFMWKTRLIASTILGKRSRGRSRWLVWWPSR